MNRKGQAIQQLQAMIVPLIVIALVLVIGFLILKESKETILDIEGGSWCTFTPTETYALNTSDDGAYCCNATICPGTHTYNHTLESCCNHSIGGGLFSCFDPANVTAANSTLTCAAGQTKSAKLSEGWNSTGITQDAIQEIPGWLPIIVITIIGAILIGLVATFGNVFTRK